MNLKKIVFPVYLVTKPISKIGTSLVFMNAKEEYQYLDDTSIKGSSLGMRRLKLQETKKLVKLSNALYFLKDIIKLSGHTTQFIDSSGMLFNYTKSKMVALEFKTITKVIPISTGGALLEIDGEFPRYKIMYVPNPDEKYIGLLRVSPKVYLVYGLYTELHKNTRRKI